MFFLGFLSVPSDWLNQEAEQYVEIYREGAYEDSKPLKWGFSRPHSVPGKKKINYALGLREKNAFFKKKVNFYVI